MLLTFCWLSQKAEPQAKGGVYSYSSRKRAMKLHGKVHGYEGRDYEDLGAVNPVHWRMLSCKE